MSDIRQTILALQVMNGLKFYRVTVYRVDNKKAYEFIIKSAEELKPADSVLVAHEGYQSFAAARVIEEITDFDYESAVEWSWAVCSIPNPAELYAKAEIQQRAAARKLEQAKALAAAKQLIEASGLTLDDLKLLATDKPNAE